MKGIRAVPLAIMVLILGAFSFATTLGPKVEVIHSKESYAPGKDYPIAFRIKVPKGLLLHGHEIRPGQMLIPTNLTFEREKDVVIEDLQFPAPQEVKLAYSDEVVEVYKGEVLIRGTLHIGKGARTDTYEIKGTFSYQVCTFESCFPPRKETVVVSVNVAPPGRPDRPINTDVFSEGAKTSGSSQPVSIKGFRFHGGLWLTVLGIFLGGLALNLTPCIYPLIPITVSFFGARSSELRGKRMIHGAMYIGGLSVTNSILGVSAALTGGMLGTALQNPLVLVAVSAIILAMGLSFFGFWEIRLPSGIVNAASRGFGGFFGSFFMGLTLGVVAAPCLGPFVLGLLTYVGQKGDPILGFLYFFVLSIGLGLPLGVLAVSSGAVDKLPMSGNWLLWIKKGFGWVLVGMAVFMIRPLLPGEELKVGILAAILAAAAFHLGFLDRTREESRTFQVIKKVAGVGLLITALFMVSGLWYGGKGIKWTPYRPGILEKAKRMGRPVIIDFFAEWCTPCREMDKTTFRDPVVVKLASDLMAVRVDLTTRSAEGQRLVERFGIRGVPTVVLIRPDGTEERSLRVESHVSAEELAMRIRAILSQTQPQTR